MGEFVQLEVSDGVGVILVNRPPVNALSQQLVLELSEVANQAALDEQVRAVVLWGGEKIFSAGADIKELAASSPAGIFHYSKVLQDVFNAIAELPKVTIAAVNGHALGGGCELALTCDFRFAGEGLQIGQSEILLGIIPGAGGTQRLPRLVGRNKAKELIFTGRSVGAEEALRIGLVDQVHPPDRLRDEAVKEAGRYAKGPYVALKAAKLAIDRGLDAGIESGLAIERASFATLFATEDAKIGFQSFLEKRVGTAEFVGR
jgi:enoyl-CoA hydratase/carnithine racemase